MRRIFNAFIWRNSRLIKRALDVTAWAFAIQLAFMLRFEAWWGPWGKEAAILFAVSLPTILLMETQVGLTKQSWVHASMQDLRRLVVAVGFTTFILFFLTTILQMIRPDLAAPRSVSLFSGLVALVVMGGMRMAVRSVKEGNIPLPFGSDDRERVLVIGAGETGVAVVSEIQSRSAMDLKVVGFLDDSPIKQTMSFVGVPVLGRTDHLADICSKHRVGSVLIALSSTHANLPRLQRACREAGVRHRNAPRVEELLNSRLHPGHGFLGDLLGRDQVALDLERIRRIIHGKTVMVTGAGGSIGSELVRQLAPLHPERLVLLGIDENSLFELDQELQTAWKTLDRALIVADIRDKGRLDHVMAEHRPDVVFHAAAHKHVPLMEAQPDEAVQNNVVGTRNLVESALAHGVKRFVNISTDKAVRPTNVMGATKRVNEMIVSEAAKQAGRGRYYCSVRFGNVIGSRGSVIPTWTRQINDGGPVTVTHPDMERYFMLIPEAVQLVMQAAELGGKGTVYVLDMGEPVKMTEVAEDLIRMHGLVPGEDIAIEYTGIRPGEKLYEELTIDESRQSPTGHPKIFIETNVTPPDGFADQLRLLLDAADRRNADEIRSVLGELTHAVGGLGKTAQS